MHNLLLALQGIEKLNLTKKKVTFKAIKPTKKAHNRTDKYLFLNLSSGEIITVFPGECRRFVNRIGGNYSSVMSARSLNPHKDINVWIPGKRNDKVKYILLATVNSMVSL